MLQINSDDEEYEDVDEDSDEDEEDYHGHGSADDEGVAGDISSVEQRDGDDDTNVRAEVTPCSHGEK